MTKRTHYYILYETMFWQHRHHNIALHSTYDCMFYVYVLLNKPIEKMVHGIFGNRNLSPGGREYQKLNPQFYTLTHICGILGYKGFSITV